MPVADAGELPAADSATEARFVEVAFDVPLAHAFTYEVPPDLRPAVQRGVRVIAPFGRTRQTGFLLGTREQAPEGVSLRPLQDILDTEPIFSPELLKLAEWIAGYYICGIGEVLKAMLPSSMVRKSERVVTLTAAGRAVAAESTPDPDQPDRVLLRTLAGRNRWRLPELRRKTGAAGLEYRLNLLRQAGFVEITGELRGKPHPVQTRKYVRLAVAPEDASARIRKGAVVQARMLDELQRVGGSMAVQGLVKAAGGSSATLRSLEGQGLVETYTRRVERDYYGDLRVPQAPRLVLNSEQVDAARSICSALDEDGPATFLIHGVTGSGKTQVYIEAIRKTLAAGAGAIVLVPEIALTPQTVRRFRAEFQERVAVLHSRMSPGERYDAWLRLREGRADVVIGPRSAVFAPLQRLGLIVVDEEHEGSYKQHENTPRYHARDIAVMRGHISGAVVVLGSATPSLESYTNARAGKYRLLEMMRRIDDVPLPEVRVLDMARERRAGPGRKEAWLSRLLVEKMQEKVGRGEQVIILQNRRGYATAVRCLDCGHVESCTNCNISLSYHYHGLRMRCHYCDLSLPAPEVCPACASVEIKYQGVGTQKVEMQVREALPDARVARMDLDTTRGRKSHDSILQKFGAREYDILIGTQMIAKGLDFPHVTLVGVVSADTGLYLPDFRAAERTFQLLTQVAGRAGRREGQGEVIIQTWSPEHFCIVCARDHDFRRFYGFESADRHDLRYPPFGRLALLQLRDTSESLAQEATAALAKLLQREDARYEVLGPGPAPLSKLQQYFRFQVLLKNDRRLDPAGAGMRAAIREAIAAYRRENRFRRVRLTVDIDPVSIL